VGRKIVDFVANHKDLEVLVLGSLGFSTSFIQVRTGYTVSQILYRLRLGSIKRADYRDGKGSIARSVMGTSRSIVEKRVRSSIPQKKAEPQPKTLKAGHHDWDSETHRCRKCGIHETKTKSLIWGCSPAEAARREWKGRKPRKALAE
jgi:hypothetical protein